MHNTSNVLIDDLVAVDFLIMDVLGRIELVENVVVSLINTVAVPSVASNITEKDSLYAKNVETVADNLEYMRYRITRLTDQLVSINSLLESQLGVIKVVK